MRRPETRRGSRSRFKIMPVNSLAPNILTVLALSAGLTAIRFALLGQWEKAVSAVLIAGVLDGLDGRLARLLKGASKFGAELDSLSDFLSFGVAPALVLYLWGVKELKGLGWILVLVFAVSCALRLARFNTALEDPDRPAWSSNFFTGIAAPAGAALSLLPMMLYFETGYEVFTNPVLMGIWMAAMAALMVSQVPTYSFKKLRVRREYILGVLLVVALIAALLVTYPWAVLSALAIAYLSSVPFSWRAHRQLSRNRDATADPLEDEAGNLRP